VVRIGFKSGSEAFLGFADADGLARLGQPERAAVEGAGAGEDRAALPFALTVRELARELDRGLVRLGARIAEEDALESGLGGQSKPAGRGHLKTGQWSVGTFKTGQ
jgi:hypothetical protein